VNGTVNDLAMSGAHPRYLSAAFIIEEGFPIADLRRIVLSMREAAHEASVQVVTGDTKVVGRGKGDQIFVNTSGVGVVPAGIHISAEKAKPGDAILLSGSVADHGMAIMTLRESLGLESTIASDTAPLHSLVANMLAAFPGVHVLRDPTRGGLATSLQEIAARADVGVEIEEGSILVRDEVRGACEILGFDPLYVANEGKLVAFVPQEGAGVVLAAMRAHPLGRDSARIGVVTDAHKGMAVLRTRIGATRVLERPYGELLPRIC
jgi:hydrogenase expression/formation protein HypE